MAKASSIIIAKLGQKAILDCIGNEQAIASVSRLVSASLEQAEAYEQLEAKHRKCRQTKPSKKPDTPRQSDKKHARAKVAACARWSKVNPDHICEVCASKRNTHTEKTSEIAVETTADQAEHAESGVQEADSQACSIAKHSDLDKRKFSPPIPPPIKENYYSQGPPESPPNGEDAQAQPSLPLGPEPGSCEPPAAGATLGDVELEPVSATGRTFDEFWEQYPGHPGGKGHKDKAQAKWAALSKAKRDEAFTVAATIAANSDRYLPDAQRFLSPTSEKSWRTLLDQETLTPETRQRGVSNGKFNWRAYDQQLRANANNPDFWESSSPAPQPEPPQPEEPEDPALAALMF